MIELISLILGVLAIVLTIVMGFVQPDSLIAKLCMKWKAPKWLREHLRYKDCTLMDLACQCVPQIRPLRIYRWARGADCLSFAEKEALCRVLDMDFMTLEFNRSWDMDEKKVQKIMRDIEKNGKEFYKRHRMIYHRADLDSYVAKLAEKFLGESKSLDEVCKLDDLCDGIWNLDGYVKIIKFLKEEEVALAIQRCNEKGVLCRRVNIVNEHIRSAVVARMKEFPTLLSPSRKG